MTDELGTVTDVAAAAAKAVSGVAVVAEVARRVVRGCGLAADARLVAARGVDARGVERLAVVERLRLAAFLAMTQTPNRQNRIVFTTP